MSPLVILFIVILIALLLYMTYMYLFSPTSKLTTNAYLGAGPITVQNSYIKKQEAGTFNYSMWVYVNSWPASSSKASSYSLVSMQNSNIKYFNMYLNNITGQPTLNLNINTTAKNVINQKVITNSFPIQKWCYVVVNVSGSTVDAYLDGKMVMSYNLGSNYQPPNNQSSDSGVSIIIGDSATNPDIYLGNVLRNTVFASPQEVWNNYSSTTVPTSNGVLPSYNLQFSLFNNGELQNQTNLI